jgi:hypothetical protein
VNYGERGRRVSPRRTAAHFVPPHDECGQIANRISPSPIPSPPSPSAFSPFYAPNDLSFYANIPCPPPTCAWAAGGFLRRLRSQAQAGIVHIANHHIAPGKKQWTWGNHEFGYAWDRNLTDPDATGDPRPYIEIMAGVYTDNQPDFSFLQPGETKTWSQYWYPIQKIGPAQHANLDAAVSLTLDGRKAFRIGIAVTRPFPRPSPARTRRWLRRGRMERRTRPGKPFPR